MRFLFLILITIPLFSQQKLNRFGSDSTLDIMTWNVEHFPKSESTIESIKSIILDLDIDIVAFQEISDSLKFYELLDQLPEYKGFVKIDYEIGLAYLYKKSIIEMDSIFQMFNQYEYWNIFPRAPLFMKFRYENENFILINNHLKCCGDGKLINSKYDEENRRLQAMGKLLTYSNQNFSNQNHIIVGDLNDDITDNIEDNVFIGVINKPNLYRFVDMEIAKGEPEGWSYPSYPSHLDHIIINNTLFDDFNNFETDVSVIKSEKIFKNNWNEYDSKISDHRPLALKLKLNQKTTYVKTQEQYTLNNNFLILNNNLRKFKIYNILGQVVYKSKKNENNIDLSFLNQGIYFLSTNNFIHKICIYK